jgi:hypothetical protein
MTPRWSTPKKVLAYLLVFALAIFSIWFIDQKVHHLPPAQEPRDGSLSTQLR